MSNEQEEKEEAETEEAKLSVALDAVSMEEVLDQAEQDFDKATKKKSRRGLHMKAYWARKREEERGKFNVYRIPKDKVEILLFISTDGFTVGLEVPGLVGIFSGNFQRAWTREIKKQAEKLGFKLVPSQVQRPKFSWRSASAQKMWADPEKRERLLKNLVKARKARAENRKKRRKE